MLEETSSYFLSTIITFVFLKGVNKTMFKYLNNQTAIVLLRHLIGGMIFMSILILEIIDLLLFWKIDIQHIFEIRKGFH